MIVLSYLFYISGIMYLVFEIFSLKMFDDYHQFVGKPDKNEDERMFSVIQATFMLSYITWAFVGLLTSQWFPFIVLLGINLSVTFKNKPWMIIRKVINILLLLFILVNRFHLKIDVVSLIF